MKLSNRISSFAAALNSNFVRVLMAARRVPVLALLLTVVFFLMPNGAMAGGLLEAGPYTAQQNGGILINNFNSAGVQSGLAANLGTIFTLEPGATYNISQIVTYQWGNGHGAPSGGTIDIENENQEPIRTFHVSVQPASGGVPANWVVNISPPMPLGPGIYIVRSSGIQTWANNSQSSGCLWFSPSFQCGFVKIMGSATLPPPPVTGGSGSPKPAPAPALVQSNSRPDLRAFGGCAPAPYLPTCNVSITITPFTSPSVYQVIWSVVESPGVTGAFLAQQLQQCGFDGGLHMEVTKDAYYFYSSSVYGNPGDQWAVMTCYQ